MQRRKLLPLGDDAPQSPALAAAAVAASVDSADEPVLPDGVGAQRA
jgi:hypothetical protein